MALGILGVRSTVVDVRKTAWILPGRDRKIFQRAVEASHLQTSWNEQLPYCQPVVEFSIHRAWFGAPPRQGINVEHRRGTDALPICDVASPLLSQATAIVALHPDEATTDIVCAAVRLRIPMVVVPCCVFARLFPDRKLVATDDDSSKIKEKVVSSYEDLISFSKIKILVFDKNFCH